LTTAFTVVAGHAGGSDSSVDWEAISRVGTIVFLMGVEHLPEIVEKLIAHGREVETPVALIREGTTQNQLVITGTLEDIVLKTRGIHPPAVLIVGEVVRLHEQLDWFNLQTQALAINNIQSELISL
jgi:uroporphyrinogen III methyltransferase/synthase